MKLIFSNGSGVIDNGTKLWPITALPAFPFACDGLFYDDFSNHYIKHMGGGHAELTAAEQAIIATFLHEAAPPEPTEPTAEQIEGALVAAVQDRLDAAAKGRGYDGIVSACSYAGAPNAFQAESVAFLTWRAACWSHCYTVLAEVQAGAMPPPSAADLIAGLPALSLP